jgi:hypothetical protein
MSRKEKLEKILNELNEEMNSSFETSKLLEYMDFDPRRFVVFKSEKENYKAIASYDPEKDKFYLLKELFSPGPLTKEQKIRNTESEKALIMHEEVHRAVIKSGLLDKYSNDPIISSTFYLDKYHSLPFVLTALKFNGRISNYSYVNNELVDFVDTFHSSSQLVKYLQTQDAGSIKESFYLLDLTNSKESAEGVAAKLYYSGLKFRDGTMFAINNNEVLVYFKNEFYAAGLNDTKNHVSVNYKKISLH